MKIHTECKFDAAHFLPHYKGACARLHGHTWKVVIEVEGEVDAKTGMLVDFVLIKKIVNQYDHNLLNDTIENPTAENLAKIIVEQVLKIQGDVNVLVRVYESAVSYAEARY